MIFSCNHSAANHCNISEAGPKITWHLESPAVTIFRGGSLQEVAGEAGCHGSGLLIGWSQTDQGMLHEYAAILELGLLVFRLTCDIHLGINILDSIYLSSLHSPYFIHNMVEIGLCIPRTGPLHSVKIAKWVGVIQSWIRSVGLLQFHRSAGIQVGSFASLHYSEVKNQDISTILLSNI
jgi:hypothetical protein